MAESRMAEKWCCWRGKEKIYEANPKTMPIPSGFKESGVRARRKKHLKRITEHKEYNLVYRVCL
jgi:hypothetical protein